MAQKTFPIAVDVMDDLRTDYLLLATGLGAALIALIYLLAT
ncbi:hypothetical protein [Bradyrhizobium sp. ARR65]|nr:hypothetical protein [Bradyrhizobium sp. ARR65]